MKCDVCGTELQPAQTDLPFKVQDTAIVQAKRHFATQLIQIV